MTHGNVSLPNKKVLVPMTPDVCLGQDIFVPRDFFSRGNPSTSGGLEDDVPGELVRGQVVRVSLVK